MAGVFGRDGTAGLCQPLVDERLVVRARRSLFDLSRCLPVRDTR